MNYLEFSNLFFALPKMRIALFALSSARRAMRLITLYSSQTANELAMHAMMLIRRRCDGETVSNEAEMLQNMIDALPEIQLDNSSNLEFLGRCGMGVVADALFAARENLETQANAASVGMLNLARNIDYLVEHFENTTQKKLYVIEEEIQFCILQKLVAEQIQLPAEVDFFVDYLNIPYFEELAKITPLIERKMSK